MKQLLLNILVFTCIYAHAQEDTSRYIKYLNTYGVKYPRVWSNMVRLTPQDTLPLNAAAGVLQIGLDGNLYLWNGIKWSSFNLETVLNIGSQLTANQIINAGPNSFSIIGYDLSFNAANAVHINNLAVGTAMEVDRPDATFFHNSTVGSNKFFTKFHFNGSGIDRTVTFQDKTGTVALLEDISSVADIDALISSVTASNTLIVSDATRGGVFNWVSSGTPDSGVIFPAIGKGSGYWKRQLTGDKIYPEWWGAGNGDSAIDSRALSHVFEYAVDSNKTAWLSGSYLISRNKYAYPRQSTGAFIKIDGGGTLYEVDTATNKISLIILSTQIGASLQVKNITLRNFTGLVNYNNSTSNSPFIWIENVKYYGSGTAGLLRWSQSATGKGADYVVVKNCIDSGGTFGMYFRPYRIDYMLVEGCTFTNNIVAGIRIGQDGLAYQAATGNIYIINNKILGVVNAGVNNGGAIEANGICVFGHDYIIRNNYIENVRNISPADAEGIYFKAYNVMVQGNTLVNAGRSVASITVKGRIKNGTGEGRSYNVDILNNRVSFTKEWIDSTSVGSGDIFGIKVNTEGVRIKNNVITGAKIPVWIEGDAGHENRPLTDDIEISGNKLDSAFGGKVVQVTGRVKELIVSNNQFLHWNNKTSLTYLQALNIATDTVGHIQIAGNNFYKMGYALATDSGQAIKLSLTSSACKKAIIDGNTADSVNLFIYLQSNGSQTLGFAQILNNTATNIKGTYYKKDAGLTITASNGVTVAQNTAYQPVFKTAGNQAYAGTIIWNGTAPTSVSSNTYNWTVQGDKVILTFNLLYNNAGANNSRVRLTLPTDCPAPVPPSGFTSANVIFRYGSGMILASNTGNMGTGRSYMLVNSSATGYEIWIEENATVSATAVYAEIIYTISP